jgi:hypothetical protein
MTAHVVVYTVGGVHPPFDDVEIVRTEVEHEVICMLEVFCHLGKLVEVMLSWLLDSRAQKGNGGLNVWPSALA